MATIYEFPPKDERQWRGVAEELSIFLSYLGASSEEVAELLPKLRARWDALGKPFTIQIQHSYPAPLSAAQLDAIDQALRAQAAEIASVFKKEHSATLIEFARLEFEIVRLQR